MRTFESRVSAMVFVGLTLVSAPAFATDEGAKVFDEVCTQCHTNERLNDKHLTREQWKESIEKMIGLGADIPKKKIEPLLDHLVRTHGPEGGQTPAPR